MGIFTFEKGENKLKIGKVRICMARLNQVTLSKGQHDHVAYFGQSSLC